MKVIGSFKSLTTAEMKELDALLDVTNLILGTNEAVIQGNPRAATLVGTVIGGAAGAAIAGGAGTVGVATATASLLGGGALAAGGGGIALGVAAIGALPLTILALLGSGIGFLLGKKRKEKQEQRKQAIYVKAITEKMQQILEKYEVLKRKHERTSKEKDDIIREQKEKLAEYEAIFEALRKKKKDLEDNLSFA